MPVPSDRDHRPTASQGPATGDRPDVVGHRQRPAGSRGNAVPAPHVFAAATAAKPVDSAATLDPSQVMAWVGEAAYAWSLATDELAWSANAAEVLTVGS